MKRFTLLFLTTLSIVSTLASSVRADDALQSKLGESAKFVPIVEPEVPDPERAFLVSARLVDTTTILVRFDIGDCCYLYRDKTKIELVRADGTAARLGGYTLPPGKIKTDEFVGKTEVYYGGIEVKLPLEGASPGLALKIGFQGCSEKGVQICYPPMTKILRLGAETESAAPTNRFNAAFWLALAVALGAGVLLSFTPCVLPMIPILSGVIVGTEGTHLTKLRGGLLSYAYVLGTAVTYAIAGALAGATGEQFQAYFQNPWAIGIFSAILVLLALSMFGFYELQMPASVQSLLHQHSSRLHRRAKQWLAGEYIGVFFLGLASALIIGACVSPVLVSALGGAITAGDPWLGAGVMFALAHGQGVILIALGIGEGLLLPKVGPWMNTIKDVFGTLLLAVGIYLLGFLPEVPVLLLWGALFIVCAVYLGATQRLPEGASGWRYLWKGLGTVLLIWGALALVGGFAGARDIFNPLPPSLLGTRTAQFAAGSLFVRVKTLPELETRLAEAKAVGKPAMLDYYADWCTDCLRMEKATFADPEVRADLMRRFVLIQADVTESNRSEIKAMKARFSVYGPPATLFFSASGQERQELRTYGFLDKQAFLALLRRVD